MKRALFIGGTGTISAAITRKIAASDDWQLFLLNRGNRPEAVPDEVFTITADINDEADVDAKLEGMFFDCVCDFICMKPADVERDWRLFKNRTRQYMFISSASAYQKPVAHYLINEGTPLANPYWQYSRDKIACEDFLMGKYREEGYPVTIIRPSHTYDERKIPTGVHGKYGSWSVAKRLLEGKPIIVQGDGTSLWTVTHNSDFAEAFVPLMANPQAIGGAFQITSDESLTWNQIYQCLADALGVELKMCHVSSDFLAAVGPDLDLEGNLLGDKACTVVFDNTRLKRFCPEFKAKVPCREGIRMAVENILAHPELQIEDPEFDAWCDIVVGAVEAAKESVKARTAI